MILLYHKIFPEALSQWWVTPDTFRNQLLDLRGRYRFVYLDEYDLKSKDQCVVTFDGIYTNVLTYAAPILQELKIPFELFLSGDHVGLKNEFDEGEPAAQFCDSDQLKKLVACGGRLQWHTGSHTPLVGLRDAEVQRELEIPQELKKLDPRGYTWFAYPHGSFDEISVKAVKERFQGAVSVVQGNYEDRFILNRTIAEEASEFRKDKITVIVPSYNYGTYLPDAIESVLRQTRPADEIIVSDDASTDNTQEVGEYYARNYPGLIRYRRNEKNLGIVEHFNVAASEAKGDLICFIGADNRIASNYLEETSGILDQNPGCGIAYTDYYLFGARAPLVHLNFPEEWRLPPRDGFHGVRFPEFDAETLNKRNFIHGSSMYRRRCFEDVRGYGRDPGDPEDYAFFKKVLRAGWTAQKAGRTFLEYRQHSSSQADFVFSAAVELRFLRLRVKELAQLRSSHVLRVESLEDEVARLAMVAKENDELRRELKSLYDDARVIDPTVHLFQQPAVFRRVLDGLGYLNPYVPWPVFLKKWLRVAAALGRAVLRRL